MSKPFSLGDELFDQTDYFGRLRKFIKIIDPRNLSYSDEEIREFQNLLVSWNIKWGPDRFYTASCGIRTK